MLLSYFVLLKADYLPADFNAYNEIYHSTYNKIEDIEYPFRILAGFFNYLGVDYLLFAILICIFCLVIKLTSFRKIIGNESGLLFIILYMCFFGFLHELTQLRLAIATSFFYLALYYLFFDKRLFWFGLFSCLALMFHFSIVFLIITLFINTKRKLFFFIITVFLLWVGSGQYLMLLQDYMPNEKLKLYLISVSRITSVSDSELNVLTLNNIVFVMAFGVVQFSKAKLLFNSHEKKLIGYTQYANLIGFTLFYCFSSVPVIAFRLPELLRVTYPLVFAMIISRALKEKRYPQLLILVVLTLSLVMCFITVRAVAVNYT